MKIWVTKYALTDGIQEMEGEVCASISENTVEVKPTKENGFMCSVYFHGKGRDWHKTKEAAVVQAEAMRLKAIISTKKKVAKLEKMKFQ